MGKSLYKFLLETKLELLIRKRKKETKEFGQEVALNNLIYAIDGALEKIKSDEGED